VTLLEPRTPHQPGKLQNVSKNDYGFNTLSFYVNENHASVSSYSSIECSSCTGGWHGSCASPNMGIANPQHLCGISRFLWGRLARSSERNVGRRLCKLRFIRVDAALVDSRGRLSLRRRLLFSPRYLRRQMAFPTIPC